MLAKDVCKVIFFDKLKRLEKEETESHFANNFSVLEPDCYDNDEEIFRQELKEASLSCGMRVINPYQTYAR
jgi:hypothetical protein